MKERGINKKVVVLVLALLCVLLFSVLSTMLVFLVKNKNNNIQPRAAYTFNDSNGRIEKTSDSRYKNNTDFYITTPKGMNEFNISVAYGCDFAGKNVYLDSDVDMNGYNWCPAGTSMDGEEWHGEKSFKGTFYGQFHTIKNISTKISSISWYAGSPGMGMFARLEANGNNVAVKNVRLQNVTYVATTNRGENDLYDVGGIAGEISTNQSNTVTIENCIVENLSVSIAETSTNHMYGGLVGFACHYNVSGESPNLILKNCLVNGMSASSGGNAIDDMIYSIGPGNSNIRADNEIKLGNSLSITDCVGNADYYTYTSLRNVDEVHFKNYTTASGIYKHSPSLLYTSWGSASSIGGTVSETGKDWYYATGYKQGCPYLREFMSWSSLGFSTHGSNSIEKWVKVPSDAKNTVKSNLNSQLANLTLTVLGETVTAQLTDGYNFDGWINSEDNYYAQFSLKTFKVSFDAHSQTTNLRTNLALGTTYYIYYNNEITITTTSYSKSGCYSSITYAFTDTGGVTRKITYYPIDGYYLTNTSINTLTSFGVTKEYVGLSVSTAQKTYSPSFG